MNDAKIDERSVGLVETKSIKLNLPSDGFRLENGGTLPEVEVAYETYGELSNAKDNVIFVCHALSGDAHAAGLHDVSDPKSAGWWDEMIGPGKGIDTRYYHVICANVLGGCKGTTGPASVNPRTGIPYGSLFPKITIGDMVNTHRLFLEQLGIKKVAAVIGGSLGGMQALEWAIKCPDMIDRCVCIASAMRLLAQALAFDIVGRSAIVSDPDWQGGNYYGTDRSPEKGLSLARKLGHITYLSPEMMEIKFGREKKERAEKTVDTGANRFVTDFQVESYLNHQGKKFTGRFDANSYLHITRAIDEYDLCDRVSSSCDVLKSIKAKTLIVALSSDWLVTPEQSQEIANGLLEARRGVSYCELQAPHGHDAFLVDIQHLGDVIRAFLPWVDGGRALVKGGVSNFKEREYFTIAGLVEPESSVLDFGCGDGTLLDRLEEKKKVKGAGADIDIAQVIEVLEKGHDVFQSDIDEGLRMVPNNIYDYAVLSETIHLVRKPRKVLVEMLRVAKKGIVSFPNFGTWSNRVKFLFSGKVPETFLPKQVCRGRYDASDLHHFTLKDFLAICEEENIKIEEIKYVPSGLIGRFFMLLGFCNAGSKYVIIKIAKK